jgi:hypothetical protein
MSLTRTFAAVAPVRPRLALRAGDLAPRSPLAPLAPVLRRTHTEARKGLN